MMNRENIIFIVIITIYSSLFTYISVDEKISDAISILSILTIFISSILSLFKVNLEKYKYFIWINVILFIINYLYTNYLYDSKNYHSHIFLMLIIVSFFGIRYLKSKKKFNT